MAEPTSKQTFIDYCFRRLGAPLIPIAVDKQQAEERVDDALSFYRDYHHDATEQLFYSRKLTTQDITNRYIEVPERMIGVVRILPGGSAVANNFMSIQWQMSAEAVMSATTGGSMIPYYQGMTYLAELDFMFQNTPGIRFNRNTDKVYINWDWSLKKPDEYVVLEGYGYLEEADYADIWSDRWLKEYATMLIKRQHGENLKLTGGIQLMGGVTINGDSIFQEAEARIQTMEEQLVKDLSLPPMDFIG